MINKFYISYFIIGSYISFEVGTMATQADLPSEYTKGYLPVALEILLLNQSSAGVPQEQAAFDSSRSSRLVEIARKLSDRYLADHASIQLRNALTIDREEYGHEEILALQYFLANGLGKKKPSHLQNGESIAARNLNSVYEAIAAYHREIETEFAEYKKMHVPSFRLANVLAQLGVIKDKIMAARLAGYEARLATAGLASVAVFMAVDGCALVPYGHVDNDDHTTAVIPVIDQNGNYVGVISSDEQPKPQHMETVYKTNAELGEIVKTNLERVASTGLPGNIEEYVVVAHDGGNLTQIVRERVASNKLVTLIAPLMYNGKQVKSSELHEGIVAYSTKSNAPVNSGTTPTSATSQQDITDEDKLSAYEARENTKKVLEEKQRVVGEKAVALGAPIASALAEAGMTGLAVAEDVGTVVVCAETLPLCGYVLADELAAFNGSEIPFVGTVKQAGETLDTIVTVAKETPPKFNEFVAAMQQLSEAGRNYSEATSAYSRMVDPNNTEASARECAMQYQGAAVGGSGVGLEQAIRVCFDKSEAARNEDERIGSLYGDRLSKAEALRRELPNVHSIATPSDYQNADKQWSGKPTPQTPEQQREYSDIVRAKVSERQQREALRQEIPNVHEKANPGDYQSADARWGDRPTPSTAREKQEYSDNLREIVKGREQADSAQAERDRHDRELREEIDRKRESQRRQEHDRPDKPHRESTPDKPHREPSHQAHGHNIEGA